MSRELSAVPLSRCLLVWSAASAACAALAHGLSPDLRRAASLAAGDRTGVPFDAALVSLAAVVLVACLGWSWVATTVTVAGALHGRSWQVPGCPDAVRRAVLAACGVAVLATAAPVAADQPAGSPPQAAEAHLLDGLPYPDRAIGGAPAPTVTVQPGDTLWALAAAGLPDDATDAEITRGWQRIWRDNRASVGPDPDLIHPGTTVHLPRPKES